MSNGRKLLAVIILILAAVALFWALNNARSSLLISNARAVHVGNKMYAVYLNMENLGEPDFISDISAKDAEKAFVMGASGEEGLAIPKGAKPSFSSDGAHIMIKLQGSELKSGAFIPLTLSLKNAGVVQVKAVVEDPMQMKSSDAAKSDESGKMDHSMHMDGAVMEMASGSDAPTIAMSVIKNDDESWSVKLTTQNFDFFEPVSEPLVHKKGQGHGHLYLNGLKLQRMYSDKATIGKLPPRKHVISVTLNTNDHKAYSVDGKPVSAEFELEVE